MSAAIEQFELMALLCHVADQVSQSRMVTLGRDTMSSLRDRVSLARNCPLDPDAVRLIDYEAANLVEAMAELSYARADKDQRREERAVMYINTLRTFMRQDLQAAKRAAEIAGLH